MKNSLDMKKNYNERLFKNPLRSKFHFARFNWLNKKIAKYFPEYESIFELGCHDAKTINLLNYPPLRYLGLDANWEKGIEIAMEKYSFYDNYDFKIVKNKNQLKSINEKFEIAICLETIEHLPPEDLEHYLIFLSSIFKNYLFISIPNEIGLFFIIKYLIKKLFNIKGENYTFWELVNQSIGRVSRVKRQQHKGFNWKLLINQLRKHYEIVEISGIPFSKLPYSFNFGIGITLKNK